MSDRVVFSQLRRKFIDENEGTPAQAQQVIYYGLAIGHHLGVIDNLLCLSVDGKNIRSGLLLSKKEVKRSGKWRALFVMVKL